MEETTSTVVLKTVEAVKYEIEKIVQKVKREMKTTPKQEKEKNNKEVESGNQAARRFKRRCHIRSKR